MKKDIKINGIIVGQYEATGDMQKDFEAAHKYLKENGLWKEANIVTNMFKQAQAFAKTADDLYGNGIITERKNFFNLVPFVVNAAFSIEIYLKTIHKIYGHNKRGHSIVDLYKSLDNKAKSHIEAVAYETRHLYKTNEDLEFLFYLKALDRAFEQWRYHYENDTKAINFLDTIYVMQVLDKACIRIKYEKEHNK